MRTALALFLAMTLSTLAHAGGCQFRSLEFNTYKLTDPKFDFAPGTAFAFCSGHRYAFEPDGNFVVYDMVGNPAFATNTAGSGATRMVMQTDGNLVIHANGTPLWQSGTHGRPGAFLRLQSEGNAVIYDGAAGAVWSTPTGQTARKFHGEMEDKQYCDTEVYPGPNGAWQAATLFSNGKVFDGDHMLARLIVPGVNGSKGLIVQHSAGTKGAAFCSGSCENAVSSLGVGVLPDSQLDWSRAEYICTQNRDEMPDEVIAEYALKLLAFVLF